MVNASVCGAKLSKFHNTPSGDIDTLMSAIYENGPISVAIDASHKSFSFYSDGVYFEKDCGEFVYINFLVFYTAYTQICRFSCPVNFLVCKSQ